MRLTFQQREAARAFSSAMSVNGPDLIAEAHALACYAAGMDADDLSSALDAIRSAKAEIDKAFAAFERAFSPPIENHQNDHIQAAE